MTKSPDAFRTISEVSELLDTPAHVLRFWESRFPQIRPVKRAGGRRYYRPADVALLTGIKRLLHDDGITIRGVQKILREQGVRHVSGVTDDSVYDDLDSEQIPPAPVRRGSAKILSLQPVPRADPAGDDGDDDGSVVQDGAAEFSAEAADDDTGTGLPVDPPAAVAEPPRPVMSRGRTAAEPAVPTASASGGEDLFSRAAPLPLAAPTPPAKEPVAEAPMAVWADDGDLSPNIAPVVTPLRPAPDTAPPGSPAAESGPTLARRLRAVLPEDLSVADRQRLAQIREQAVALRARLAGPARAQG